MKNTAPRKRTPALSDPIQFIKGVGPKRALLFEKLDLRTVEDCLYFLPFRYEDRTQVRKISELTPGERVTLSGEIIQAGSYPVGRRKKIFELTVRDETGTLLAKWFRFNEKYMLEKYPAGCAIILSGKPAVNRYSGDQLEMIHPDVDSFSPDDAESGGMGSILPVYHTTDRLHLKSLRAIMKNVVATYAPLTEEILPPEIVRRQGFPSLPEAFRSAHQPPSDASVSDLNNFRAPAQRRLIFEEFFLIQLGLAHKKKHAGDEIHCQALNTRGELIREFLRHLPFELTGAQKKVLTEIMEDLEQDRSMNRLLQGDVGSGKTLVALICLLTAVDNGAQAALMAPTELLTEQHYLNIEPYCSKLGITLAQLTSSATPKEKETLRRQIQNGQVQIVIGTHALIQQNVHFKNLALAVIDEQHRFGVRQREAIAQKGVHPHTLVMTATPIPRSLALTLYGDLSASYLDEFPPGRKAIATHLYYDNKRGEAYEFLRREVANGRQAYVVCPLIEESETTDLKAAMEVRETLQRDWFPNDAVRLIHGKIKSAERARIMADFLAGKIPVLVATTVIEVGIDAPNATVIVVEHAERFGLAQLHQLRGRVGRGAQASHCLLIAYPPLTEDAKARTDAMIQSNDGFYIAEEDLKIRGPGDFMGARQSGMPLLRVANLLRDLEILEIARKEAFALIDRDPHLAEPGHKKLKLTLEGLLKGPMKLLNII